MPSQFSAHKRPSKEAQGLAKLAYPQIVSELSQQAGPQLNVRIEGANDVLTLPREALELLRDVLSAMAKGKPVSIVPLATELSTQAAADRLGCSRPHLIKLLETGDIPFTKVGRHRRVRFEDLLRYEARMRERQAQLLAEIMADDEEAGLYDVKHD